MKYLLLVIILTGLPINTQAEQLYALRHSTLSTVNLFDFTFGCSTCNPVDVKFTGMQSYNQKFILKTYNMKNFNMLELTKILEKKFGIKIHTFPLVIIGNRVYQGKKSIFQNLNEMEKLLNSGYFEDTILDLNLIYDIPNYTFYVEQNLNIINNTVAALTSTGSIIIFTLFTIITLLSFLTNGNFFSRKLIFTLIIIFGNFIFRIFFNFLPTGILHIIENSHFQFFFILIFSFYSLFSSYIIIRLFLSKKTSRNKIIHGLTSGYLIQLGIFLFFLYLVTIPFSFEYSDYYNFILSLTSNNYRAITHTFFYASIITTVLVIINLTLKKIISKLLT